MDFRKWLHVTLQEESPQESQAYIKAIAKAQKFHKHTWSGVVPSPDEKIYLVAINITH